MATEQIASGKKVEPIDSNPQILRGLRLNWFLERAKVIEHAINTPFMYYTEGNVKTKEV
ncbi:MAG: hypothetical protein MK481_03275 [SAR324 cluster bacterium]|nr:hypothetical protein [SAR324 cluster bacterium]